MAPWWSDQMGNTLGGIGGGTLGSLCGIWGSLAGNLAPRGRCKPLIYGLAALMLTVGVVLLIAGITALSQHQSRMVWFPLLLPGGLITVLMSALTPVVRLRYRQAEMRRLEAEEFRRS